MTQENPFIAPYGEGGTFEQLADGMYSGVICGVVVADRPGFDDKNKLERKCRIIIQVCPGEGATYYFTNKWGTPICTARSNLFVFLQTATGATLEKIQEKYPNGFPLDKLIGIPVQVVIQNKVGKDGKTRAELLNTLKAAKGQNTPVVPDAIPAYLARDVVQIALAEGLTVKQETPKAAQAPAQPATAPASMPFHQNPAAPVANQGLSVTQPAPNPQATADPVVPEADDEDLPF